MAQWIKQLPQKHEGQGWIPRTHIKDSWAGDVLLVFPALWQQRQDPGNMTSQTHPVGRNPSGSRMTLSTGVTKADGKHRHLYYDS